LGDNFLGGRLPSFCLPFFWFFWLIVTWCIVLLLHPLPSVLLDLFVPPVFSVSWLRHESWGGVSMYVDTLSTLGPHSSPHPSSPCVVRDRGRRSPSGIPPVSLLLLSLDPKPPLGFHSLLFFF
jgi:hypothetical protein